MGTIAFGASDAVVDLKFLGAGDIVGTVRDHEGDLVSGAYVRAEPSGADEQSRATLTDSAGRFAFNAMPLGETTLSATDTDGVLSARELVEIREPGAIVESTLRLEPGFLVAGQVMLENGLEAANAMVRASMEGQPSRTVNTDAFGNFNFARAFPPGELVISASLDQRRAEEPVLLEIDGQTNRNIFITLSGQGRLIARLVDAQGSPSSGAEARLLYEVSVCRLRQPVPMVRYSSIGCPAGSLELSFQSPSVLIERALWQGALSFEDEMVNAGDVQLAGMVSVTGVIESETGVPVSGEILTLTTLDQTTTFRRSSNELGRFAFDSLPMGTYTLAALNPVNDCRLRRTIVVSDLSADLDLGTLGLDCTPPSFQGGAPAHLSGGTDPSGAVSLVFSEELDSTSIVQGSAPSRFERGGSNEVYPRADADAQPQEVLNGFTEYRVVMRGARSTADSPLRDEPH